MTFAKPYAEWRGMFAGNGMLLPKSMTATPEAFNKGQLEGPGPSAGPFVVSSLDRTTQRIVLSRNPKWWGARPRLDSITYLVLDDAARLPALQNNTIDATGVGTIDQLTIAQHTLGISIRRAPAPAWSHFTFNGAPGSILADKALRVAVSKGIDRQTIAKVVQYGLTSDPVALGNHIYVAGQQGYQDNSSVVPYDPAAAGRELDALGWKRTGQFREKNGRQLVIRDLFYDAQGSRQFAQIAQHSLAQIGVRLELVSRSGSGFFTNYINVGAFDMAQFGWLGDAFPLSALTQIYKSDGESNFGKIGSEQIDAAIEGTLEELDPAKARALANDLDKMIWAEGFSLPLTQSPGDVAVRSTLANFGAAGLADLNYTAIGFTRELSRRRSRFGIGRAPSATAAAPSAFHSNRTSGRGGSASSAGARAASPFRSPRRTASAVASATGSRKSSALCAMLGRLNSTALGSSDATRWATAGGVMRSRPPETTAVGQLKFGISAGRS